MSDAASYAPIVYGKGKCKAVVMNGWMGCATDWKPMLDAMDPAQVQVAVFEYRGYGSRRDVPGKFTFEEAAQDVVALADSLGWSSFALIGQSMGGMAVQRAALAVPDRITGMLGMAPVSAAGSGMDATRLAMFEPATSDPAARNRIIQFSTGQRLTQTWSERVALEASAHLPAAMLGYLREWAQGEFVGQVSALRDKNIPVKVLIGEHDPSINIALAERTWLAHYPHAELEIANNAGHYPMLETPLAIASKVQAWLLALNSVASAS